MMSVGLRLGAVRSGRMVPAGRDRELGHGGRDQSGSGADRLRRGPERGRVRTTATIGIGTGRCRHPLTADAGAERSGDGSPGCDGARHLRSSGNESPDQPVPHMTPLIARGARSQPVPLIRVRARHDREAGDGWPGSSRRSPGEAPPFGLRRQPLQGTTPPPRRSARFARLQPKVSPRLVRPPERSAGSDYATRNDVPRIAKRLSHHGSVHACNKQSVPLTIITTASAVPGAVPMPTRFSKISKKFYRLYIIDLR